jgi:hypothetical protein
MYFPLLSALAFGTAMSDKRKFTSLSAMQVKKRRKTFTTEET